MLYQLDLSIYVIIYISAWVSHYLLSWISSCSCSCLLQRKLYVPLWCNVSAGSIPTNLGRKMEFVRKIQKLATNLAIWSHSYQSCYKLRHEVGNYVANLAMISRTSWSKVMANLKNWMSLFRDKVTLLTFYLLLQLFPKVTKQHRIPSFILSYKFINSKKTQNYSKRSFLCCHS